MTPEANDSVSRFGAVLTAALTELESRQREIDDLNVFPVADGDTGRNMVLTLRGLLGAMGALRMSIGPVDLEEVDRDLIVRAVGRAALSSAHGNSGVILSQLIRGAARELGSGRGRKVSPFLLGRAMRSAAEQGLASMSEPREGTMLTVARDIADALEAEYPEPVLIDDAISPSDQDAMLARALRVAVEAGSASVDRGPELLDVLREKGVVDAGGYGLVVILAGALASLEGNRQSDLPHRRPAAGPVAPGDSPGRFSYCVNFTLSGSGLDPSVESERLRGAEIGDSVLVVGDSEMVRIHIHTDLPDEVRGMFEQLGTIEHFEQEDMNEQVRDRDRRLSGEPRSTLILLGHDPGLEGLVESEAVRVASVDHSGLAVELGASGTPEVVVVSTSGRSHLAAGAAAAEAAAAMRLEIVEAANLGAALLGIESCDARDGAAVNAERIRVVLDSLVTGGIRDDGAGGGEAVLGDSVVASGSPAELVGDLLGGLGDGVFITAVVGPDGPLTPGMVEAAAGEVDVVEAALDGWHMVFASER